MFYIIFILLIGISYAPFLFSKIDIWHAQGFWVQICILTLFSCSFFEKPKFIEQRNIPLGLLHFWVGGFTAFLCFISQTRGVYNVKNFFPYFNFLCLLILYKFIVQYLSKKDIEKILEGLRWVIISTLLIASLQVYRLAQFFELLEPNNKYHDGLVVGFIGNGSHLSGFLASCLPLFLMKTTRENILCIVLLFVVLCYSGQTSWDPSISGFIIAPILLALYLFRVNKRILIGFIALGILIGGGWLFFADSNRVSQFFNSNGRWGLWSYYWGVFRDTLPISGHGVGKLNIVYKSTLYQKARHVHLEYLQFLIEIGIIGMIFVVNMIQLFIQRKTQDNTQHILKLMVIGFLLSCCFNYPAHLWLPSTWALFAYAAFWAIEGEKNGSLIKKRN